MFITTTVVVIILIITIIACIHLTSPLLVGYMEASHRQSSLLTSQERIYFSHLFLNTSSAPSPQRTSNRIISDSVHLALNCSKRSSHSNISNISRSNNSNRSSSGSSNYPITRNSRQNHASSGGGAEGRKNVSVDIRTTGGEHARRGKLIGTSRR